MPNSGPQTPSDPIPVLVQDVDKHSSWQLSVMHQWRWVDETSGTWEGHVELARGVRQWIPGTRLRRVGGKK